MGVKPNNLLSEGGGGGEGGGEGEGGMDIFWNHNLFLAVEV